jgi:hypothetical protein
VETALKLKKGLTAAPIRPKAHPKDGRRRKPAKTKAKKA